MEWMDVLKERRTYRRFKQTPVGDDVIQDMLTAARYASSAANKQPLRYIVVKIPFRILAEGDLLLLYFAQLPRALS